MLSQDILRGCNILQILSQVVVFKNYAGNGWICWEWVVPGAWFCLDVYFPPVDVNCSTCLRWRQWLSLCEHCPSSLAPLYKSLSQRYVVSVYWFQIVMMCVSERDRVIWDVANCVEVWSDKSRHEQVTLLAWPLVLGVAWYLLKL